MIKFCIIEENFDITISAGLTSSALQKMLLKAGGGLSGRTRTISTATPCCKIKEIFFFKNCGSDKENYNRT